MDKIENPSISASSHNVTTDDNVYFTIDMTKGSDVHILIDFQDGSIPYNYSAKPPGSPWAGAMVLNRTFINGCTCTVTATIWNAASTFTVTVDVLVLVGFSAFSWDLDPWNYYLYEPPALVAFKFTSSSPASPTDPTLVVDWGDGIKPVVENAIRVGAPGYSRELDDTLDFEITVTMSNMMGSKVYKHKAIVVEKLVGPAITTQYTDAPLNQPLNVTFSLYRGDNQELTNLTWDFGDGNGSFTVDRMGSKTITVIARAPLGQMVSATKTMEVVNAIDPSALVITVAGDVSFGSK
ncbi:uncharacterized protein LOC131938736 [Physella acuta]|uniref:uncharacterized protein LOC131938736 n=1 Tax=Physella acuta TaxID=109671 RepID=UPI0027DD33A5|nr:uncharacterized protein LOC131938736 [Physella acuta]